MTRMPQYVNFDITVDGSPDQYYVAARGSGETQVSGVPFEYDEQHLHQQLARIRQAGGHGPSRYEAMKAVGRLLYNALFPRPVREIWTRSQARLAEGDKLRLRLNIRPPALSRLPWELLYDSDGDYFLAVRLSYPIVRYIESGIPVASALARHPLRVLYLQSNPLNTAPLDLEASEKAIRQALGANCEIKVLRNPTPDALLAALREKPGFHILHYDGHAQFDERTKQGYLALHNAKNKASMLSGQKLGIFLDGTTVRLVVLSACQTGMEATNKRFAGIAQHLMHTSNLPAAVAMQFAISDHSATLFIRHFYQALAADYPLEDALIEGRKGILASVGDASSPEWATPVLFMRAKDGYILEPAIQEKQIARNQQQPSHGGINIGNNAQIGELYTGGKRQINTGGGAYFEGNVNTSGGNFAGGHQINVGSITGIIGDYGQVTINQGSRTYDKLATQFAQIYQQIRQEPEAFQDVLNDSVGSIQEECAKGAQADIKKIEGKLAILARMAPDICDITANTLLNPIHGLATAIQKVAHALALRGKPNNSSPRGAGS